MVHGLCIIHRTQEQIIRLPIIKSPIHSLADVVLTDRI